MARPASRSSLFSSARVFSAFIAAEVHHRLPRRYPHSRYRHRAVTTTSMARRELAVAENVPGDLFVDDSCIECDTCRELAPDVFGSLESGQSFVRTQPGDEPAWRRALHAVVSCPTSSIGTGRSAKQAASDLPVHLEGPVYR